MWSNDYPHAASPWPHSRKVIAAELGHLPKDVLRKVVREKQIDAQRHRPVYYLRQAYVKEIPNSDATHEVVALGKKRRY